MRLVLVCLLSFSAASAGALVSSSAQAQKPGASKPAPAGTSKTDEDPTKKDDPKKPATETTTAEDQKKKSDEELIDTDKVEATKAIYISGDLGFTRSDLGAFSDNTGFDRTAANGVLYGLGAGYRVKGFRVGLRWRVYDTTEFSLWTVAASAGYALPLRPLTPIFSAHLGYVFDQKIQGNSFRSSLPEGNVLPPDVDVKGLLVGLDANASYWLTKFFRLGVFLGADVMFLHRSQAPFPQSLFGPTPEISSKPIYTDSGSGIGLNVNLGVRGAFDIGLQ
jgi:hypothetical protein